MSPQLLQLTGWFLGALAQAAASLAGGSPIDEAAFAGIEHLQSERAKAKFADLREPA